MKGRLLLAFSLSILAVASSAGPIEDQIRFRQSAYSFAAWNLAKLKNQVVTHPDTFDKAQVIAAARAIAGVANSGLEALYGPGTDQGSGWQKTRLKPEFFQKPEEAKKLGEDFAREANELARLAETGEVPAIKAQFGKLSATCKSCHDTFRLRDAGE